jgi:hypothetical protein
MADEKHLQMPSENRIFLKLTKSRISMSSVATFVKTEPP